MLLWTLEKDFSACCNQHVITPVSWFVNVIFPVLSELEKESLQVTAYIRNDMLFNALMVQIVMCRHCTNRHANIEHTTAITITCYHQLLILRAPEYILVTVLHTSFIYMLCLVAYLNVVPEFTGYCEWTSRKIFCSWNC